MRVVAILCILYGLFSVEGSSSDSNASTVAVGSVFSVLVLLLLALIAVLSTALFIEVRRRRESRRRKISQPSVTPTQFEGGTSVQDLAGETYSVNSCHFHERKIPGSTDILADSAYI